MLSAPLFSPAGGPIFTASRKPPQSVFEQLSGVAKLANVAPASQLAVRPTPEMVSCGVRELDALTGGLPRGCLSEICGSASSGRTSVLLAALAAATNRQEACVLVDTNDMFDPESASAAGVNFERLLWVRCDSFPKHSPQRHRSASLRAGSETEKKRIGGDSQMMPAVEQALRVTDLLLQSGGFGMVAIDLGGVPFRTARRIPLTSWFRFQRAVEHTPTVLLVITPAPCAQSCATLLMKVKKQSFVGGRRSFAEKLSAISPQLSANLENASDNPGDIPSHTQLLKGFSVEGELLRSRLKKPVCSVTAFETKAICTG
jgi:hypothetical protein